jgi:hypothetical protein
MRRARLRWVVLGGAAATLTTKTGRKVARRSVAAYFQPSISFLPETHDHEDDALVHGRDRPSGGRRLIPLAPRYD